MPSQQSLREFVGAMDEAGFLKRTNDEIRVDQIFKDSRGTSDQSCPYGED